jgi:hypothetical protein
MKLRSILLCGKGRAEPKILREPLTERRSHSSHQAEPRPTSQVTAQVLWLAIGCRGIRLILLLISRSASRIALGECSDTS